MSGRPLKRTLRDRLGPHQLVGLALIAMFLSSEQVSFG